MKSAIVLCSGGMDSFIHLYWARKRIGNAIAALFVHMGYRYVDWEFEASTRLFREEGVKLITRVLPLGDIEQEDAGIPLRNLYLLQFASYYSDNIVFGMLRNESPPDKNPKFVQTMQRLLTSQYVAGVHHGESRAIRILTPFSGMTKTQMLRWYIRDGGDPQRILGTIGCYSPGGKCGRCISCFNRWVALTNNGLSETYKRKPYVWAFEQLTTDHKKGMRFDSLRTLWFKRAFLCEVYQAMKTISPDPLALAYRVRRRGIGELGMMGREDA